MVEVFEVIYVEEVGYVVYGFKWFYFFCGCYDFDFKEVFYKLVCKYFYGVFKFLFNEEKCVEVGLLLDFYWFLVDDFRF